MKTIKRWFNHFPEPIRSQAIKNWENCKDYKEQEDATSLSVALEYAFYWENTPQQSEYWVEIRDRAIKGEYPIEWPESALWQYAPKGTFSRAVDENGDCCFYIMRCGKQGWCLDFERCGRIENMQNVDWRNSLQKRP